MMIDALLVTAILILLYVLGHMLYNRWLGKDELEDLFGIKHRNK